jgi:hypothetical protein
VSVGINQGPSVKLVLSCFECEHCGSTRYTCQGDSGSDVYCKAMNNKPIGDTTWKTPDWCPFREVAINQAIANVSRPGKGE